MTTLAQFEQLKAAGYNTIPVYRQRLADTETPLSVLLVLRIKHRLTYLSLLKGRKLGALLYDWFRRINSFSCNAGVLSIQHADGSVTQQNCLDPFQYIREFQNNLKFLRLNSYRTYQALRAVWWVIWATMLSAISSHV